MLVTTSYGKSTIDPLMLVDDDDVREGKIKAKDAVTRDDRAKDGVSDTIEVPLKMKLISRPLPPFP